MLPEFPLYSLRRIVTLSLQSAIAKLDPLPTAAVDPIPVRRQTQQKHSLDIVYQSAIAFRFSRPGRQNLTETAIELVSQIPSPSPCFSVRLVPPAWIHFDCSEAAVAAWLDSWLYLPPNKISEPNERGEANLFPLQYAHARCCSMLRLAATQGWLQIDPNSAGNFLFPDPVAWFDPQGRWYLTAPHEARTIASLVDLTDSLGSEGQFSPPDCLKLAMNLADSFWGFESLSNIFSGIYSNNQNLVLSRLALILAIRNSLKIVIEQLFKSIALREI